MKTFDQKLKDWQRTLLDLSDRNYLIDFKLTARGTRSIELSTPEAPKLLSRLLDNSQILIQGTPPPETETAAPSSESLPLPGLTDTPAPSPIQPRQRKSAGPDGSFAMTPLTPQRTNHILSKMKRAARASLAEQGTNILFAAFGLLEWKSPERYQDRSRKSPLLLLPISIEESPRDAGYTISALETEPELNLTLAEKLFQEYGYLLPRDRDFEQPNALAHYLDEVQALVSAQEEWQVHSRAFVGLFQFHKIRMYQDLDDHRETAENHPIVRALAFEDMYIEGGHDPAFELADFDASVRPQDTFSVLDADSSQQLAIQAAINGQSFVLQGPPGTGKSQTIANIISEFVARGRTVLFVSEKQAALDVVYKRLADAGLEELCLSLHSHRAERSQVIKALGARLEQVQTAPRSRSTSAQFGSRLFDSRMVLNGYASALHEIRPPLNLSVFQAIGKLAKLDFAPLVDLPITDTSSLTEEKRNYLVSFADRASGYASYLIGATANPWAGFVAESISTREKLTLVDALEQVQQLSEQLLLNSIRLAKILNLQGVPNIGTIKMLAELDEDLPSDFVSREDWFQAPNLGKHQTAIAQTQRQMGDLRKNIDWLSTRFTSDLLDSISSYSSEILHGPIRQPFSPEASLFRGRLKSAYTFGPYLDEDTEFEALDRVTRLVEINEWFQDSRDVLEAQYGISYPIGGYPDPATLEQMARSLLVTEELRLKYSETVLTPATVNALQDADRVFEFRQLVRQQPQLYTKLEAALAQVEPWFSSDPGTFSKEIRSEAGLLGMYADATRLLSTQDQLESWLNSRELLNESLQNRLTPLLEALFPYPPEQWSAIVDKALLLDWLEGAIQDPRFTPVERNSLTSLTTEFRELDIAALISNRNRVRSEIEFHTPAFQEFGEPSILKSEILKKRKHKPLRILFQQIPNLLLRLTPCLMMSPLSVAQYLPANKFQFDLVLFDEASQVRPHDAIGAIMRGKQLIVAGDRHQLPPTSFFDYDFNDGSEDEEAISDYESILDTLSAKGMRTRAMRWHYRSRDESLIAFSNRHIYGNSLVTFPSPGFGDKTQSGVSFHYVSDGILHETFDTEANATIKANRPEARRVAELVLRHAQQSPDLTLMVVTLGIHHREVVQEEIDKIKLDHPELRDFFDENRSERFEVKSLETVQGDERDVVIISVGFAKDPLGKLSHNFGPINRDGGERRINVLVTRARQQVVVVSSIRSADIDLTRSSKRGTKVFRDYLEFAEFGQSSLPETDTQGNWEYDSDFEEAVAAEVRKLGFEVHSQIGCSGFRVDLAVVDPRNPGRYLLGIECDGATYHSSKTARDRDRLRQEVLESLGWKIHRIWSTEWFRSKDKEVARLLDRVQAELENISSPPQPKPLVEHALAEEIETPQEDHEPSLAAVGFNYQPHPYLEATITVPTHTALLYTSRQTLVDAIEQCVNQEWPVHTDLVIQRIARHWGNARTGNRIREYVAEAIQAAVKQNRVVRKGDFLWKTDGGKVIVRGKMPDGRVRDIEHVPSEEILGAFQEVLQIGLSMPEQDLLRETSRRLGYERTGKDVSLRLAKELKSATTQSTLILVDDRYELAKS
jgi:very-short-patch-repair endonuclease